MFYKTHYTDHQLFNPHNFVDELTASASKLEVFRNTLKHGHEILKSRFQSHMNATEYVIQRAWLVDQILLQIYQHLCICSNIQSVALVAVGGYGRGELHPGSDVDLMILLASAPDIATQSCIEHFITFLWDIRLQVGHSVRTLDDCVYEATADISVATNLMEARLIQGPQSLFDAMQDRLSPDKLWPNKEFFEAKLQEQTLRHQKYHDTAYNLEPNIKEGPGGLRDIQMIGWVAKRHFGAKTLHDLIKRRFLTEYEYRTLIESQEFIWKIRCLLHLFANRREDRLLFDYQKMLASAFNYHDDKNRLGVEQFMKQYFRTVMVVRNLNDMLLQFFQEAILYAQAPVTIYALNKRFQVRNDFIEVAHDKVFMHYPFALLELFLLMQQNPGIKGVRASTIRLIRHSIHLIDEAFHKDLRARSLFFEILRQPQGLTHALRRMSNYGILGAYIPAFGNVVGQMQYDLFHVYTVDQHSLFVVRNLRRFTIPQYHYEFPLCSKIIQRLPKPELLYLAGLFHDIAKGRGGDHSQLGELEALNFCQAHGLSDHDARFVAWLVREHLNMSLTAQRQDTSDPEVIKTFAQRLGDTTRLDYLYLLTVADIRATNPKLWNAWKAALLTDLYHKAYKILQTGIPYAADKQFRIEEVQDQARRVLHTQVDSDAREALWESLGDDYFLCSSARDVARETQAILNHVDPRLPLILERKNVQGFTEFTLYTLDRDHLFADTTHFLEQQNVTVVNAYIIPTQDAHTLIGFAILESDGSAITQQARVEALLQGLEDILVHCANEKTPFCPIHRHIPRQLKYFPVPTRVTFKQDMTHDHSILEVVTTDRPGVLFYIAQAFVNCQVRVKKAKIATFGSRVEDIFFITDHNNQPLYSADQIDCVCEQLSILLDDRHPPEELAICDRVSQVS